MATSNTQKGRPAVFPEIGTTGLKRTSGILQEEFLNELRGRRGMKVYREMCDNSAIVGACLGAIEMLIRQVSWFVKPPAEKVQTGTVQVSSPDDKQHAAVVESSMHDMSFTWAETVTEALTMLPFGWAYLELVYKRRGGDANDPTKRSKHGDGLIGWRKIPLRAQETLHDWTFDDEGGIQAMRQLATPDWKIREIPIQKALLFRPKSAKNNPEGRSILRNAYFSWYFAKRMMETEAIGIERDLSGIPVAWVPVECFLENATDEQKAAKAAMDKIVKNIRNDEQASVTMPHAIHETGQKLYDLTLLSTGGRRTFDTNAIIQRYEMRIAVSIFYDLLTMGQPNVIQYKGKDLPELFAASLGGWCDVLADVFNSHALPRLYRLNGWSTENMATICHGDVMRPDLGALGDYISKIGAAGMALFPDDNLEQHLRRVADLPDKGAAQPLVTPPTGPGVPGPDDDGPTDPAPAPPTTTPAPIAKSDAWLERRKSPAPLRIGEFSAFSGIDRAIVKKWLDTNAIRFVKTSGGERRIPIEEAERIFQKSQSEIREEQRNVA